MDANLKMRIVKVLCGKRCNYCFHSYKSSDVIKEIPEVGDKFKQSFEEKQDAELIINYFAYISKYKEYTRDKISIYKSRNSVQTYVIEIICENCGYNRAIEVSL